MFKNTLSKKKLISTFVMLIMVLSAFVVISGAASAQVASGTVTYTPSIVTVGQVTSPSSNNPVIVANGGSFSSVTEFYFYWSTSDSVSGLISSTYAFTYMPQAGSTTFVNALLVPNSGFPTSATISSGETLYLLASPSVTLSATITGVSVMGSTPFTVSPYSPHIFINGISSTSAEAGSFIEVSGSGFAPTATSAAVYIDVNGVNTQIGTIQLSDGSVLLYQYVQVPNNLPYGYYLVYAVDPVGGEIASAHLTILPAITVSPMSITGATTSTFTINGYGFPAGAVIAPYSTFATAVTVGSVNAIQAGATVASNGQFTLTVTGLSSAIITPGPQKITITLSNIPTVFTNPATFINAIYVSSPNPAKLGFIFYDYYYTIYGYPTDPVVAAVFDFPANTQVNVMLGSYLVGTITTDANGYGALPKTATLPEMPYGDYIPVASVPSMGLYAIGESAPSTPYSSSSPFIVNTLIFATDPAGNLLPEYVPYDGLITVYAYGLNPTNLYEPYDTGTEYNLFVAGVVVSVSVGTVYNYGIYPAANGTIIFTYQPYYASSYSSSITTSTPETFGFISGNIMYDNSPEYLSLSLLSSLFGTSGFDTMYYEIGAPTFSITSFSTMATGSSQTVTISNLIPAGSTVYPGVSTVYSLYLGTQLLTVHYGSTISTTFSFTSTSGPVTFTVPNMPGLQNLSVVYAGQTPSSAIGSLPVIVSTPGTSYGTIGAIYTYLYDSSTSSYVPTLIIYGYNFAADYAFNLYYMTYNGVTKITPETTTDTYGAFEYTISSLSEPAGTYSVFMQSTSGVTLGTPVTYTVTPYFVNLYGAYEPAGASLPVTVYGLQPNTYYDLYLNGTFIDQELTDSSGTWSHTETVPVVPAGEYTLWLASASSPSTPVVSQPFVVITNPSLYLSTAQGMPTNYAFPTQLISFYWAPATSLPSAPSTTTPSPSHTPSTVYGPIYVTVYLNGTAYTTFPATPVISSGSVSALEGSFLAPNSAPGSYWAVSFGWSQNAYTSKILNGTNATGITEQYSYMGMSGVYLGLVSGNGALMISISSQQIASIITSSINQAMQVPLSELNAAITALNGTVATIKTSFGTMTATLQAINASVQSVYNGQATILTDLGTVQTSLANLTPQIQAISGAVVSLTTSVGTIQTTLTNLAPVIMGINTTTMNIATVAGNISMNLTAFHTATMTALSTGMATVTGEINGVNTTMQASLSTLNAKVTAINGTVFTIQTALGTAQATLNAINGTVTSSASSISGLVGSTATISSSLGTISGTITSVSNGVATIQTNLGTLTTTVNGIKTTTSNTSSSVGNTMIFEIVVLVLILITLALVAYTIGQVRKQGPKKPEEIKAPEEEKKE